MGLNQDPPSDDLRERLRRRLQQAEGEQRGPSGPAATRLQERLRERLSQSGPAAPASGDGAATPAPTLGTPAPAATPVARAPLADAPPAAAPVLGAAPAQQQATGPRPTSLRDRVADLGGDPDAVDVPTNERVQIRMGPGGQPIVGLAQRDLFPSMAEWERDIDGETLVSLSPKFAEPLGAKDPDSPEEVSALLQQRADEIDQMPRGTARRAAYLQYLRDGSAAVRRALGSGVPEDESDEFRRSMLSYADELDDLVAEETGLNREQISAERARVMAEREAVTREVKGVPGRVNNAVGNFVQGAASVVPGATRGLGAVLDLVGAEETGERLNTAADTQDRALSGLTNEYLDSTPESVFANVAGTAAPFLVAGMGSGAAAGRFAAGARGASARRGLTGAAKEAAIQTARERGATAGVGALGATLNAGSTYDKALESGASDVSRRITTVLSAGAGVGEAFGIGGGAQMRRHADRLAQAMNDRGSPLYRYVLATAREAGEEANQDTIVNLATYLVEAAAGYEDLSDFDPEEWVKQYFLAGGAGGLYGQPSAIGEAAASRDMGALREDSRTRRFARGLSRARREASAVGAAGAVRPDGRFESDRIRNEDGRQLLTVGDTEVEIVESFRDDAPAEIDGEPTGLEGREMLWGRDAEGNLHPLAVLPDPEAADAQEPETEAEQALAEARRQFQADPSSANAIAVEEATRAVSAETPAVARTEPQEGADQGPSLDPQEGAQDAVTIDAMVAEAQEAADAVAAAQGIPAARVVTPEEFERLAPDDQQGPRRSIRDGAIIPGPDGPQVIIAAGSIQQAARDNGVDVATRVRQVMQHERSHEAGDAVLAPEGRAIAGRGAPLDRLLGVTPSTSDRAMADLARTRLYDQLADRIWDPASNVGTRYAPGGRESVQSEQQRALLVDEYFAWVGQNMDTMERGVLQTIIDAVRRVVRDITGRDLTDGDIREMLRSGEALLRQASGAADAGAARASRSAPTGFDYSVRRAESGEVLGVADVGAYPDDAPRYSLSLRVGPERTVTGGRGMSEGYRPEVRSGIVLQPEGFLIPRDRVAVDDLSRVIVMESDRQGTGTYTGLREGSPVRVELQGGVDYSNLAANRNEAAWANDGGGTASKLINQVLRSPEGHAVVGIGSEFQHQSNYTNSLIFVLEMKDLAEQEGRDEAEQLRLFHDFVKARFHTRKAKAVRPWHAVTEPFQSYDDLSTFLRRTDFPARGALLGTAGSLGGGTRPLTTGTRDGLMEDYGIPDAVAILDAVRNPVLDDLPTGAIVSAIQFDKEAIQALKDQRLFGLDHDHTDIPEHLSYRYAMPGKGIGWLREAISALHLVPEDPGSAKTWEGYRAGVTGTGAPLNSEAQAEATAFRTAKITSTEFTPLADAPRTPFSRSATPEALAVAQAQLDVIRDPEAAAARIRAGELVPDSLILAMLGDYPEYLDLAEASMLEMLGKLEAGAVTPRDMAKAYAMTLGSVGAGAMSVEALNRNLVTRGLALPPVDEMYTHVGATGRVMVRPEHAVAMWLGSDMGQRALDAVDRGEYDAEAWEHLRAMRDAYGRSSLQANPTGRSALDPRGQMGLPDMAEMARLVNEAGTNEAALFSAVQKLYGVAENKAPFIAHLLGLGTGITVDARELNVNIAGVLDTRTLDPRVDAAFKTAKNRRPVQRAVSDRMLRLASDLLAAKDPAVRGELIHHWIWDRSEGVDITHAPMYAAQLRYSRSGAMPESYAEMPGGVVPEKTVKAYKLFRVREDRPGELFPLFVNANTPVPMGEWLVAEEGEQAKGGKKVKSKIGPLAYRPGWHAGDLPLATHIGSKSDSGLKAPDLRPADQVWAEVEMPDDVDWQAEAESRAKFTKAGKMIARTAQITDQLPIGGHYRYRTNSNMVGSWLIGGAVRVTRILTDAEVAEANSAAGVADLPRSEPFDPSAYGFRASRSAPLLAPNGQPTNLNPGQYEQVRTPEFKAWFGDWENDPTNASKVVDENGEPMVVYHGTRGSFDQFETGRLGMFGVGAYFTPLPQVASDYATSFTDKGASVMPVFLNVREPVEAEYDYTKKEAWATMGRQLRQMENGEAFDGAVVRRADGAVREIVVPRPTQIKSATGNSGAFSPTDPDIRHSRALPDPTGEDPRLDIAKLSQAAIDETRRRLGLMALTPSARQGWEDLLQKVLKEAGSIESATARGEGLAGRFLDPKGNPVKGIAPLSAEEHVAVVVAEANLLSRRASLEHEAFVAEANGKPFAARSLEMQADALVQRIDRITAGMREAGSVVGRAMAARRMQAQRDTAMGETISLIKSLQGARRMKGAELTADERRKIADLVERAEKAERKVRKLEAAMKAAEKTRATEAVVEAAKRAAKEGRTPPTPAERASGGADAAARDAQRQRRLDALAAERTDLKAQLMKKLGQLNAGLDPETTILLGKYALNIAKSASLTLQQVVDRVLADFPGLEPDDVIVALATPKSGPNSPLAKPRTEAEYERSLLERRRAIAAVKIAQRAMKEKTLPDRLLEAIELPRALMSTADVSAFLRQGGVLVSRRPRVALRAMARATEAMFSEDSAESIDIQLRRAEHFELAEMMGVFFGPIGAEAEVEHAINREEDFASRAIQSLPGVGRVVAGSERHYVTFLNLMRYEAFAQFYRAHPEASTADYKAWADYVNKASGRGDLKSLSGAARALSSTFFSPRFTWSRWQVLTALAQRGTSASVRAEIFKEIGAFIGFRVTAMALMSQAVRVYGDDEDNEDFMVGMDPASSDFGKIVIGSLRVDLWAGVQQPVRAILRIVMMGTATNFPGALEAAGLDTDDYRAGYSNGVIDIAANFFGYKLAPPVSAGIAFFEGQNAIGEPQGALETLGRSLLPLSLQEGDEALGASAWLRNTAVEAGAPEWLGTEEVGAGLVAGLAVFGGSSIGLGMGEYGPARSALVQNAVRRADFSLRSGSSDDVVERAIDDGRVDEETYKRWFEEAFAEGVRDLDPEQRAGDPTRLKTTLKHVANRARNVARQRIPPR